MTRHGAKQALLLGWYLLLPDFNTKSEHPSGGFMAATDRPLGEWGKLGVFDTAKECEKAQAWHIRAVGEEAQQSPSLTTKSERNRHEASECIASDDPRLK